MSYTPPPGPPGNPYGGQGPGDGPPPPPGQPGYGYGPTPTGTNNKAVIALVLGIVGLPLSLCCSVLGLIGIPAIILGRTARREIAASGGGQTGDGLATWGFVLGIVDVVIGVLLFVIGIVLAASGHRFGFNTYGN
jgi:hypothetical protein